MAKKKHKKQKKEHSVRGIYFALILWLICSQTFPMYTFGGQLTAAAVTIAGTALFSVLFRKKKSQDEDQYEIPYVDTTDAQQSAPQSGYGPEVDSIIQDGNRAMSEMGRLYASIDDPEIKKKINELMRVSDKIVQDAIHDPADVPQIRKFLDYYLPTTIKLLNAYDRMDSQGIQGENIDKTKGNIVEMLDTAIEAFKKQLDSLFANQALDIETDIDVMNTMLKREGLAGGSAYDFKLH